MIALCRRIFFAPLMVGICLVGKAAQPTTNTAAQINSPQAEMEEAIHQVEKIVNQTVLAYRRAPRHASKRI